MGNPDETTSRSRGRPAKHVAVGDSNANKRTHSAEATSASPSKSAAIEDNIIEETIPNGSSPIRRGRGRPTSRTTPTKIKAINGSSSPKAKRARGRPVGTTKSKGRGRPKAGGKN